MKEQKGVVFKIPSENQAIPGCTVSKEIHQKEDSYVIHFSMAEHTDISAEIYEYHKFIIVSKGRLRAYAPKEGLTWDIGPNECFISPLHSPIGIQCGENTVYTEISFGRTIDMNTAIQPGEVWKLSDLLPYQDGKVVNMDIAHNSGMKFLLMSFDKGTGLAEHAAPGEALLFALDGEASIVYEGKEHLFKAGESFCFAKNGKHAIKAHEKFKMALLLTLE